MEIKRALLDLTDVLEMASLPYVLLGETARAMMDGKDGIAENDLNVDIIEVGVFQRNMTPEVLSLFKTWKFEKNEKGYTYKMGNVPIQLVVVQRRYKFFDNPDQRFYGPDTFKLPNPFENYWKARFIIQ